VLSRHFERGNECAYWIFFGFGVFVRPRYHLLDSFASWQGVNRETDERGRGYGRIGILQRASQSLFFIQIFLGNIILRYLMRANLPLISAPSVFHARHYVSFERVSLLEQLVDTLRIRTLDVG